LARRIEALPADERRAVIGISGGQDSTHALLVATHAMDLLGLDRQRIIGVTMPGFGTTTRTRRNAGRLMEALGVTSREMAITPFAESVYAAIGHRPEQEDRTSRTYRRGCAAAAVLPSPRRPAASTSAPAT
jgi:NAD+ synthase (glutamine-hydrolysing)